ncbi:MAG: hypothetical protein RKP20_10040 [Candidatus Competibacter sp.]|nr:hypothetical protein [Candidatus Competibacter sp.]
MSRNNFYLSAHKLAVVLIAFVGPGAFAENLAADVREPTASNQAGAIWNTPVQTSTGRYRLTGTALDGSGNPACALALASGRCMFTCGPGSLRCEGGTASLPFGQFDLTDLPTEANGTIVLQVFVQGFISSTNSIPVSVVPPPNNARWSAYNDICCSDGSPITYDVTVDGITKRSVATLCTTDSTFEGFASTPAGTKGFSTRVSGCGLNSSSSGTVTMVSNACYRFQLDLEGQSLVNGFGTVTCPSSAAGAHTLREDAQMTPMAVFPFSSSDGEDYSKLRRLQPR